MGICCNEVFIEWMKFLFFFSHYTIFVIVITVSMNPMCESDNIRVMLVIKPWNPNFKVPSARLGYVRNLRKFLILLISSKAVVRGSTPTLLILNFVEISK